jgi:hypothetical protein
MQKMKREEVSKSAIEKLKKRNHNRIKNGEDEKEKDDQNQQYKKEI